MSRRNLCDHSELQGDTGLKNTQEYAETLRGD